MELHEIMATGVGVPENGAHYTVGPWLTFDPVAEKHTGDFAAEANALLSDPHNDDFQMPVLDTI
jgi:hypothetical protein